MHVRMNVTLPIVSDGLQSRRLDTPERCKIVVNLIILMDVVLRGVCPPENESGQFKLYS